MDPTPGVKTSEFKVLVIGVAVALIVAAVALIERKWLVAGAAAVAKLFLGIAYILSRGNAKRGDSPFLPSYAWLVQTYPARRVHPRKSTGGRGGGPRR